MARGVWAWIASATGLDVSFSYLEGMWGAGKKMQQRRYQRAKAKISQFLVPAVAWAIWLSRNQGDDYSRGLSPTRRTFSRWLFTL
ncbi:hypothetical protein QJS10_CPA10g00901 [Acorus calamus]|uniref:Uncharacterized protein n=1 Tax=Acorus calamus TaxID=4465 RepID=A0AAV9E137_ACOCL|nr:hypothetical protein QJS10_CPA10g00901 [Acorus calamus]